jgi:hypothetical protein
VYALSNGTTIDIEATSGDSFAITAITNAAPPVVAAADAAAAVGDVAVFDTLGWTGLNGRAFRATAVSGTGFTLGGQDTTNTGRYPTGGGVGEGHLVDTWTQISQVTEVGSTGGEQQFLTFGFLEEDDDRQLPTTKSPASVTLTVANDRSLPFVAVVEAADQDRKPRAIRFTQASGESMVFSAYVSISPIPAFARNELVTRVVTLSFNGRPAFYAAPSA